MANKPKNNEEHFDPTVWKKGAAYYDSEGKLYTEDEAKPFSGDIQQSKEKGVKRIDPAKTKEYDKTLEEFNKPLSYDPMTSVGFAKPAAFEAMLDENSEQLTEEGTDENFVEGSEAGYDAVAEIEPSQEQVDEGQTISDEIQNTAFNEDGTPNAETIKSVGDAAAKALGVKVNVEDGTLSVEDFKAPSLWSSADAWGKASIVLTALSALATALTFGRIPPINFMALSGVKEKWITEAQQALKNYNEVVTPQLKQASEAFGENIGEGIRATQDEETARQAAKIEGIMSTAHDKAMTEINKINWDNQAEANAYLEKAKADLQISLKLVDRDTQAQLLSLQQEYAQQMTELSMNLQMARDNNNNALQQKLVKQASDLQSTLRTREAEALSKANIDQTKISKVVSGLNGISSAAQSAATVQSAVNVGTSIVDSIGGVVSEVAGSIFK